MPVFSFSSVAGSRKEQDERLGRRARDAKGFTLVELVLAMFISTLVMGILGVSLSVALRFWERTQNQKAFGTPNVIELLKRQLAQFSVMPATVDGKSRLMLSGDNHSITLATDHSVKAISRGVPVIARYVYSAKDKQLFYTEVPLNPHHLELFEELRQLNPGKAARTPMFFAFDMEDFSLAFARDDKKPLEESWDGGAGAPSAVLVSWKTKDSPDAYSYMVYPNSMFAMKQESFEGSGSGTQTQRARTRERRTRGAR